ncbi:MAG: formylglycine-generating enzyme family protein [Bacteroidales bacterium]|jgi:formylglycine-generating enzyme required for sulfatase activity|nr:formylglycine-generating enzyme family protein [Bacteroidales bacterium]
MKNIFKTILLLVVSVLIINSCDKMSPIEIEMIKVEGGTFLMGCDIENEDDCHKDEIPIHSVTLTNFSISKYLITQAQWKKIMGNNPSENVRGDNYPVTNVSWIDAQEFCERLSRKTGRSYRLPTEAEWEYAAKGGNKSKGYKFSGSNNLDDVGWYKENSGGNKHPVGRKLPNELGIYDMSGNVWQWCNDIYGEYSNTKQKDPTGPDLGSYRIIRGGSWGNSDAGCRNINRNYFTPSYRDASVGFRIVLD